MAEKATASTSKTQPGRTFTRATATAVPALSPFAQTECVVSLEKHLPKVKLPRPAGLHPVFYDLRSTTASEEAIIDILPDNLLGCVFRSDIHLVEMDCISVEAQEELLAKSLDISDHTPLIPIPPQHNLPNYTLVKLSNVPVRSVAVMELILRKQFEGHGEIVEIGPHQIANRQWITRRWDLVIKLPSDRQLEAPTLFEVFSEKVHAWWIRSPKTCLTCKTVGHLSSSPLCPRRRNKKSTPIARPAAATADPGVSSSSATAVTLTPYQKKRLRRKQKRAAEKAAASAVASTDATEASSSFTPPIPTDHTDASMEVETSSNSSSPDSFPFIISVEQAQDLARFTYAQWMVHVNKVRDGYPNPVPEVEAFLKLPRSKIIDGFRSEVD